jgi:D,D-heptose 1,7-bisphosphate phosphatase
MRRAVFLDRDGTIIVDENYLADPSLVRFLPGALDALRRFRDLGMMLVIVSNQSGIPRGFITPAQHEMVAARTLEICAAEGVTIDAAYYCPHLVGDGCECRKPRPGLLQRAAREHDIDLGRSFMIGDKLSDIEAGLAVGCTTGLLGEGKDKDARANASVQPHYRGADWPSLLLSMETSWKT